MSDKPRIAFLQYIQLGIDDSVIGIPRALVMLMKGDWTAAAMLNQIMYWCGISDDPDNWFWKTDAAWMSELCLTRHQLTRYKALVQGYGVETKLRKVKGAPTTHYRVNEEKLQSLMSDFREHGKSENTEMDNTQKRQIRIAAKAVNPLTEITEETTNNTDVSNDTSMRPAETTQHYDMVSDHVDDDGEMVKIKPTIFKATLPDNPKPPAPSSVPPPRPAQPHIAPLLAWFGALGDSIKPTEFEIRPYTQWGKELSKQIDAGVTSLDMITQAGQLAKAWYEYNFAPDPMLLRWDVGSVITMQRAFANALRSNVTVDEIRECLADMIARGYWQGKNVPFDKLLAHIPEWRRGAFKPPQRMANPLPSQRERKPDVPIVSILDATQKRPLGGA